MVSRHISPEPPVAGAGAGVGFVAAMTRTRRPGRQKFIAAWDERTGDPLPCTRQASQAVTTEEPTAMSTTLFRRPGREKPPEMPSGELSLQEPPTLPEVGARDFLMSLMMLGSGVFMLVYMGRTNPLLAPRGAGHRGGSGGELAVAYVAGVAAVALLVAGPAVVTASGRRRK
jgi:hypothetical protein